MTVSYGQVEYVRLRVRASVAEHLRPLLEARLQDAQSDPDPRASIDAEGWREYLELLDEARVDGEVDMPFPSDVLYDLAREALSEGLRSAQRAVERHQWERAKAVIEEALVFARVLVDDDDPSPWRG